MSALNIDMPKGIEDAPERQATGRRILRSMAGMPCD